MMYLCQGHQKLVPPKTRSNDKYDRMMEKAEVYEYDGVLRTSITV